MSARRTAEIRGSVLPWAVAGLLWFGLIAPMRADQQGRLSRQSQVRRDRLHAEKARQETQELRSRVANALGRACRASSDPAALRQRTVAATAGLGLSPFSLSVTGGPGGGAQVDTAGGYGAVGELLKRLGNPAQGGFLRSATLRRRATGWALSLSTGVIEEVPATVLPSVPPCPALPDPGPLESAVTPPPSRPSSPVARPRLSPSPEAPAPPLEVAPAPPPPFTLVAFLTKGGRTRASIAVGGVVRVVSPGDRVDEWTCVSIDRDQGVVFSSPSRGQLVLKPRP